MNKQSRTIIQQIDKYKKPQIFEIEAFEQFTLILVATTQANYEATVKLIGEGAHAQIFGMILGNDIHNISIKTLQEHRAPKTTSNLLIKSALAGRCQFFYEGFIKVHKEAQRTDAYQRNENLMLSPAAKAESKPALEILANDVRCTHSATIGKIDEEQLFYLESRGIGNIQGKSLIIRGFFQSIIDKLTDKRMKESLIENIYSLIN